MDNILKSFKSQAQEAVDRLKVELKSIRTGRASSSIVETLDIEAYGGMKMKLRDLASITVEGIDTIVITPFDQTTVQDIEKGILTSPIGVSPKTEGTVIYVKTPPLTEEQRTKYAKLVSQNAEDTKQKLRYLREDARKSVKLAFENKDIGEDEKFRTEKKLDEEIAEYNKQIQDLKESKESEIMRV